MFNAFADHTRRVVEYVDSTSRVRSKSVEPEQESVPSGITVQAAVPVEYKQLLVDQPMQFPALDFPSDASERVSDLEPIPFANLRLHLASFDQGGEALPAQRYSYLSNHLRGSVSALSIDWDPLELEMLDYEVERSEEMNVDSEEQLGFPLSRSSDVAF